MNFIDKAREQFLASALYDSVLDLDLKSIKYLLSEKKANPNYILPGGAASIHIAAGIGDEAISIHILEQFLEFGGNPNLKNWDDEFTPLHVAANENRWDVLMFLFKSGGNIFFCDSEGFTPIDYLKGKDLIDVFDYVKQNSINITESVMKTISPIPKNINETVTDLAEKTDVFNDAVLISDYSTASPYDEISEAQISDIENDLLIYNEITSHKNQSSTNLKKSLLNTGIIYEPLELDGHLENSSALWNTNELSSISFQSFPIFDNNYNYGDIIECEYPAVSRHNSPASSYHDAQDYNCSTSLGSLSSCPTEHLKTLLKEKNMLHGPILKTTKRVYLYQLKKIKSGRSSTLLDSKPLEFNDVVISTLNGNITDCIEKWSFLESNFNTIFANLKDSEVKLDFSKQYFTYLLIDPTISENIKQSYTTNHSNESWITFLRSIFYIGKGKKCRPMDHLIDAIKMQKSPISEKIQRIRSIWDKGLGIVCIQIFHNITEAEALTREACMLSAMKSSKQLTNVQSGRYYGGIQKWSLKNKKQLGVIFLYRSMMMFMAEGERQLFPSDIRKKI